MRVIDLFAWVWWFSLGFKQAGFDIVYANEFNKSIAESYKLNHPEVTVDNTDIRKIDIYKTFSPYINNVDVIIWWPPCQWFSQKGKRVWLLDERNFLFKKFIEVVTIVKPEFFVIENVPNILTAEKGFFKNEIIETFSKLWYDVQSDILQAEKFWVPQKRRRAVFLWRKKKLNFCLPSGNNKITTVLEAISDLPALNSWEWKMKEDYLFKPMNEYQSNLRKNSSHIYNHIATNHSKIALERLALISLDWGKEDLPESHRTKSIHSWTWTRMKPNWFARTITTRFDTPSSGQFTLPFQDRCITVREAARIQSFPDDYIFYWNKTTQMLQVWNAVPPMLSYEIAKKIRDNYK